MHWKLFATVLLCSLLTSQTSWAQPPCESGLSPVDNLKLRYQNRQNRCEGMYNTRVTNRPSLELVSLTHGEISFPWKEETVLQIWVLSSGTVRIRAVALPRATYYRMDARLAGGAPLVWPARDVLRPAGILPSKLGIFAWHEGSEPVTYVPVLVRPEPLAGDPAQAAGTQAVVAVLRSSVGVQSAQWRIVSVVENRCSGEAQPWQDVQKLSFDRTILRILLPPTLPDEFCLEVLARRSVPASAESQQRGGAMPAAPVLLQTVRIGRLP